MDNSMGENLLQIDEELIEETINKDDESMDLPGPDQQSAIDTIPGQFA